MTIEYLIVQSNDGAWTPPKGHLKKDETFYDAAIREIQEEVVSVFLNDYIFCNRKNIYKY